MKGALFSRRSALLGIAATAIMPALAAGQVATPPRPALLTNHSGAAAPKISFVDRKGKAHTLQQFEGKVVVVNLWATWCIPCRTEMPALERLARKFPNDLVVIAISHDSNGWAAVDRFWAGKASPIQNFLATGPQLAQHYGAIGLPYSVLIDRSGKEVGRTPRAAEWDKGAFLAAVQKAVTKRREGQSSGN